MQQHHKQPHARSVSRRHSLSGHSGTVFALSASDALVASGGVDRTVKVWDVESGNCAHTLRGHTAWVSSLALSASARVVVSGSWDGTVRVWSLVAEAQASWFGPGSEQRGIFAVDWAGTSVAAGGFLDASVADVYDLESRALLTSLVVPEFRGNASPVEADQRRHGRRATLAVHYLLHGGANGGDVEDDPLTQRRSDMVVTGGDDGVVRVWDVRHASPSAGPVAELVGHSDGVTGVSSGGTARPHRIVSCSADKTVRVWDWRFVSSSRAAAARARAAHRVVGIPEPHTQAASESGCVCVVSAHSDKVFAVAAHGDKLTTGGADGTVRIHRFAS